MHILFVSPNNKRFEIFCLINRFKKKKQLAPVIMTITPLLPPAPPLTTFENSGCRAHARAIQIFTYLGLQSANYVSKRGPARLVIFKNF